LTFWEYYGLCRLTPPCKKPCVFELFCPLQSSFSWFIYLFNLLSY
jgi:hypothetical protein